MLAGLAAVPFCLKVNSWHMLSTAGFLIFNWFQGMLVALLISMSLGERRQLQDAAC